MLALTLTLMLNVNRTLCHKNIHTDITDNTLHNVIFKIDISSYHADIKLWKVFASNLQEVCENSLLLAFVGIYLYIISE